jgi:adenylate cyclase
MFLAYLNKHRKPILFGFTVTILIMMMQHFGAKTEILQRINGLIYDVRLNAQLYFSPTRQSETNIIIIDIDEKSLEKEGRWPWSRIKVAKMIEKLADAGALVVTLDAIFSEPERNPVASTIALMKQDSANLALLETIGIYKEQADADTIMANSLHSTDVVLGMLFLDDLNSKVGQLPPNHVVLDTEGINNIYAQKYSGHVNNVAILQDNSKGTGFINSSPETDGFLRRTSLIAQYDGQFYPSLALETARLYTMDEEIQVATKVLDGTGDDRGIFGIKMGSKKIDIDEYGRLLGEYIPTDKYGRILVPYKGPARSYPYVSATDLLHDNINVEMFENSIILIGTSAVGNADLRSTPVGVQYPGVEVHANVVDALLNPLSIPREPGWTVSGMILLLLLIGVSLSVALPRLGPLSIALNGVGIITVLILMDYYVWSEQKYSLPMATTFMLAFTLTILNIAVGYFTESGRRKQIKGIFDQYVPPAHIDAMLEHPELLDTSGIRKEMTVLFSDIRSFTSISEKLTANELATLLSRYFSPITKSIFEHNGTIDKYVGDMVMAFWNAPLNDENHVANAIKCSFDMLDITEMLTREFEKEGWPEIKVGIGLNTGEMNVGDMGSEYRRAYTVLGDAVNLGSRLESLTKFYGVDLLVNETCVAHCPEMTFRPMDKVRVKGKDTAVSIFEPIRPEVAAEQHTIEELEQYHQAYQRYLDQDWPVATEKFNALICNNPDRKIYSIYLERIDILQHESLEPDWDGSFTHTSK